MQGAGQEIIDRYVASGEVKLVYWPMLDLGPNSEHSAVAAFCAGEQDPAEFWRYHDHLFANQGSSYVANRGYYVETAAALGLDGPAFEACYDDDEIGVHVRRLDGMRRDEGIRQRPTFDVGGQLVLGNQSFALFDEAITAALAE